MNQLQATITLSPDKYSPNYVPSKQPSPEDEQVILFVKWAKKLEQDYPQLKYLYHPPLGGYRPKSTVKTLKDMGMKAGSGFDIQHEACNHGYTGLKIEMKYGDNYLSEAQEYWLRHFLATGKCCLVTYCWQDAARATAWYLNLPETIITELKRKRPSEVHRPILF